MKEQSFDLLMQMVYIQQTKKEKVGKKKAVLKKGNYRNIATFVPGLVCCVRHRVVVKCVSR